MEESSNFLAASYKRHDLDFASFGDDRLGVFGAPDHHQVVLDSDHPPVDLEPIQECLDGERPVELERIAVQRNAHGTSPNGDSSVRVSDNGSWSIGPGRGVGLGMAAARVTTRM